VVHPLTSAAVTYIVQRVESLMALFYLLTLYCSIRAFGDGRTAMWTRGRDRELRLGMARKRSW